MTLATGSCGANPARWMHPGHFAPCDSPSESALRQRATSAQPLRTAPVPALRPLSLAFSSKYKDGVAAPLGERRGLKPTGEPADLGTGAGSPLPSGSGVD
jgi:hypothetical protein